MPEKSREPKSLRSWEGEVKHSRDLAAFGGTVQETQAPLRRVAPIPSLRIVGKKKT